MASITTDAARYITLESGMPGRTGILPVPRFPTEATVLIIPYCPIQCCKFPKLCSLVLIPALVNWD
jgi:hypothetical protein